MEAFERLGRGRAALMLITVGVGTGAVRMLSGRRQPEEAELADLHSRPKLDRQRGHIRQLQGDVAAEAGIDETGSGVSDQAEAAKFIDNYFEGYPGNEISS